MSGRECGRVRAMLRADMPPPRADAAAVAAHLAGCAGCRAYAAQERAARAALALAYGRVDPLPLGPGWRTALPGRGGRGRGWGVLGSTLKGALAVALVAVVALVGGLALRGVQAGPRGLLPATPTSLAVICTVQAMPTPTPERRAVATRPGQSAEAQVQATIMANAPRPTDAPPSNASGGFCAAPVAGLLTLDAAAARARAFLGEPDARFGGMFGILPFGTVGPDHYYVVELSLLSPDGAPTRQFFQVDALTGMVLEAHFPDRGAAPALAQPLGDEEARGLAADYARAHFPAFGTLTYGAMLTNQTGDPQYNVGEAVFVASWQLLASESGAYLPTRVQVAISPRSGQIVGYSARQDDYTGPTAPRITREEAEARAREAQLARGFRDVPATGAALYAMMPYSLNAHQAEGVLVWAVQFPGYVPVYIDALTGEVVIEGPKG